MYLFITNELYIMTNEQQNIIFKTLADPNRRALFERLCEVGDLTVKEMTEIAGISQPAVSKHLTQLKEAHLVSSRIEGRNTHYAARRDALKPLINWTEKMQSFWLKKFDDLENLLERMDQ